MKSQKLKENIESLTHNQLVEVIAGIYDLGNKELRDAIEQSISAYDPKALSKNLSKQISAIKRSKKFIDYKQSYELSRKLDGINQGISQLLSLSPELALTVCKQLIALDNAIFERVDDSGGSVSGSFMETFSLLGKSFVELQPPPKEVAEYLLETFLEDDYGVRGYILDQCKPALKGSVGIELKKLLDSADVEGYMKDSALKTLADAQGDVDGFIKVLQQENKTVPDRDLIEVAQRLNNAFRSEESIKWLNRIPESSHHKRDKFRLLVDAYRLEGDEAKCRSLIWDEFQRMLQYDDYINWLKYVDEDQRKEGRMKAEQVALQYPSPIAALIFLDAIGSYDKAEKMVLELVQRGGLTCVNQSAIRKLSTSLASHSKYLAATLLRRELVEDVLTRAVSKYYKYGISDLKKAKDFSEHVQDWESLPNHEEFVKSIHQQHQRKHSFWSQVETT